MKKCLFICALFLQLCTGAFSQSLPTILLNQLTEEQGLSNNGVQCVLKDSQGFVWIGTSDGLNLLDGSAIQVFRHSETDPASLPNDNIQSLAEDGEKNIWIATNVGMSCYQRSTKKFFSLGIPFSNYGASNIVKTVMTDRHNRLWCATDGGLFLYNLPAKSWTPCSITVPGERLTTVNKIFNAWLDKSGTIWLCTFDGLWSFDTDHFRFKREVGRWNDKNYEGLTTAVFEDEAHRLWFGNWSNGLKLLDKKTGKVSLFDSLPGAISNVTGIGELKLPGGRNVICLNGSLTCFDAQAKRFFQLPRPSGLTAYPEVKNFYQSADGWLWMCSDKGLWSYNPQRQFFQHYFFPQPITSQGVNLLDWKDELLVGGEGKNFLAAYRNGDRINTVLRSGAGGPFAATLCLAKEGGNSLLVASSVGLFRYNLQTGTGRWITENTGDKNILPTRFIQHVFIDAKGQYWIFPWRSGIYTMNGATGACQLVYKGFLTEGTGTKGLVIADAAEDEEGHIWMADLDEGIILYDRASHTFSKPFQDLIGGRSRSARVIYRDGFCYAFANERLLKWNARTKALLVIKAPAQMRSDIYDLALDNKGYCWMATKKGLLCYNPAANSFKQFTTADGLLSNDMDGNLYVRGSGLIVFATPGFLTQFVPQDLLQSSAVPASLVLTGLEVNGENRVYDSTRPVHLDYTQNNLLFRWAVTDYTAPLRNQYWCRLKGIDADWKYVGNRGEVQFANLSPGSYTLLLKGATANGVPADSVITLQFKITPPFWKTFWFWAIWVLLAGAAVYRVVSRRIKNIRAKAAMAQQISELEVKALKAQMNPHFIFNSLSSIQESIVSGKTEAASRYLGKFSKLIRGVLENSDRKLITLPQELDYLKLYLELESFRFDDFSFSLHAPDIEDAAFVKIPPMLVQPYVENAIKHGLLHKEGPKRVIIFFEQADANLLKVTVEDNGIGRQQSAVINGPRAASHRSMGMKITEERLSLQRSPARGVEISDLLNEQGEATGTRVTIFIAIES